jgi:predicted dehydrogenase
MSKNPGLRWGYMGTGRIAELTYDDFTIAGLHVQAVGSRTLQSANAFAQKHGIADAHGSYEELVNNPNVDIIYVNTLNHLHCENALLAINAGKHVLLEKPFTMDAKQALKIQKAARAKNVFVMEAMWSRFLPSMDAIFDALASGVIGKPQLVIADHSQYLPVERSERLWKLEHGGGALLDLGIYPVSFAARVLGLPDEVLAVGRLSFEGVDESTSMVLNYEDGSQASLTTSMTAAGPCTASVIGEKGSIEIDRTFYQQTTFTVYDNDRNVIQRYDKEPSPGRGRHFQAIHAEACIAKGLIESPIMSVEESVDLMQILDDVRLEIGVVWDYEDDLVN